MNPNPLQRFFRQPSIYIRLPSQGQGWPVDAIDMPQNGELPVLPMTAMDEITYRTPDALFNGEATVSVIQSCVPNIRNAWATPSIDLDTLLVAIRIASYGHNMDMDSACPKCENENTYGLDLRSVLDKFSSADFSKPLEIGDMTLHFRPLSYREMTENNQLQFEQQKTLQMLNQGDSADAGQQTNRINAMMKALIELTVRAMSHSIREIRLPDAQVQDHAHIEEFLNNCDRTTFTKVRDHAISLRESAELKPLKMRCLSCQHEYEQMFTLDMARFFGSAS